MPNYSDKINFYNKLYRVALLSLAIVTTVGVIIGVRQVFVVGQKLDSTTQQIQIIIQNDQASTLEARKANIERQEDLKNYIKCLSLARFDNPELVSPNVTKQQVSDALDKCAGVQ